MYPLLTGRLTIETLDIAIEGLPKNLDGLKIIQMSDFHADGLSLSKGLLNAAITASNREYPDLVLLTGDYVTSSPDPIDRLAPQLKKLESRYGTFAILGNHDLFRPNSHDRITQRLTEAGITVLWNEICYPCGPGLALVGFADLKSRQFYPEQVMPLIPDEIPRLVMAHNPDCASALANWRVDLQLSGHTHGGQIYLPGLGSLPAIATRAYHAIPVSHVLPGFRKLTRIRQNWDWERGYHQIPRQTESNFSPNRLYTNRGLGSYLPGRFFCSPEVTKITLYSKSDKSKKR